jgi:hypothetical protein
MDAVLFWREVLLQYLVLGLGPFVLVSFFGFFLIQVSFFSSPSMFPVELIS